ncbi:protein diaphanous [Anaeramoeba flamelloides]|uniref:Protein diaphanous n=1 Tax=Anaeramoeba flamelloides TaxID=1746091 RepID=A0ABQ8X393_9EUKA|nr:protein diaphanous [Anaeramoeba flamelloides]
MKRFKNKSSNPNNIKKIEDSQKEISKEELSKVNQNFEKLISMMNLDPNKQQIMRNLPLPQKLKLLEGSQLQKQAKTVEEYIQELSTKPNLDLIQQLSVELRTSQISWVKEFVEASGHVHLLDYLRVNILSTEKDLNLILECSKAVKSLMNNTYGLMAVLKLENSIKILALGMTCSSEKVLQIIMDLLAAISTFPEFNENVNECINNIHFEKNVLPYSLILNILTQSRNVELKTSTMTLIHGLTSNPDIAQRIKVRFLMFEIGLGEWLGIVTRKKNDSLTNLIELFENNMSLDMKELEETFGTSEFNLFSSEKIMKQISDQIKDEEFSQVPLNILHTLIFLLYKSPFERQDIFTSIYDLLMGCIQNIDSENSFRNLVFRNSDNRNEKSNQDNEKIIILSQRSRELEKEIEDNSIKFKKIIRQMKNYYEIMINRISEQSENQNRIDEFKKKYSRVLISLKNENENLLKTNKDLQKASIKLQETHKTLLEDYNKQIEDNKIQVNNNNENNNNNNNNKDTKTTSTIIKNKNETTVTEKNNNTRNNQIGDQNKQIINDEKSKLIGNQTTRININTTNQIIKAEESKISSTNNISTKIGNEKENNTMKTEIKKEIEKEIKKENEKEIKKEIEKENKNEKENENEKEIEKENEEKKIGELIPPPPILGGVQGLPPPPNFGGDGGGGLPPPPNFGGGGGGGLPPPPNMGGSLSKKPNKPRSNTVALNWKKLPKNVSNSGYWSNISVDEIDINVDVFKKIFEKKKKVSLKKDTSKTIKTNQSIISGKKISNVEIILRKLKKNEKEIVKSILELDENVLNEDSIRSILTQLPTDEENTTIREYKGDFSKLSLAEKYFKELLIVENVEKRLKTYGFNLSFQETIDSIEPQIRYLERASIDLKESENLKTVIQIILKLGNLMNGGSFRGGAIGFNLEILPKLKDTKSTQDRSLNLMNFFAKILTEKYPKTLKILETIPLYEKAANIDLPMLTASINNIEKSFNDIEKEIQYFEEKDDSERLKQDFYLKKMKPFLIKAKKNFERISETLKYSINCFETTIEHFGMKDDKTTPKYFFGLIKDFLINLRNANKENLKRIEVEKKKRLIEERKNKRFEMKKNTQDQNVTIATDKLGVMDNLIEQMRSGEAFKLKKINPELNFNIGNNNLVTDFRSQLRRNVNRKQINRVSRIRNIRDRK